MAPHIIIGDLSPRVDYTASAAQTVFPYTFPIFSAPDLMVYVNGVLQVGGYTVAGAGADAGGTVTFGVGMIGGEAVTLRREVLAARTTDFTVGGDFGANTLNTELDRITAREQELRHRQLEMLAFPPGDAYQPGVLPAAVDRANKALGFDETGAPVMLASVGGGGGGGIATQDEGVAVNTATTLNFTGAGVSATDAGAGVATITIPGGGGGGGGPIWCGTATGTANAIVLTPAPAHAAYVAGDMFVGRLAFDNTSDAVTLAVSGLAAKSVQLAGENPPKGALQKDALAIFTYTGAAFEVVVQAKPVGFATRAEFVAAIVAGQTWANGAIVWANGYAYRASIGATGIPDLLGFVPVNPNPNHYGFNPAGAITLTATDPWRAVLESHPANSRIVYLDGGPFVDTSSPIILPTGEMDIRGPSYATMPTVNASFETAGGRVHFQDLHFVPVPGKRWYDQRDGEIHINQCHIDAAAHNNDVMVVQGTRVLLEANGEDDMIIDIGPNVTNKVMNFDGGSAKLTAAAGAGRIKFNTEFTTNLQVIYLTQCDMHWQNADFTQTGGRFGTVVNVSRESNIEGASLPGSITMQNYDRGPIVQGNSSLEGRYMSFTGMHWPVQLVQDGSKVSQGDGWTFTGNDVNAIVENAPFGAVTLHGLGQSAPQITYNNATSGLAATEVKAAIDELAASADSASNATSAGIPFKINSTDSTTRKMWLQDNGTSHAFLGASALSALLVQGGDGANHFEARTVAGATNYLRTTPAVGGGVTVAAVGASADIDLILAPKGTGKVLGLPDLPVIEDTTTSISTGTVGTQQYAEIISNNASPVTVNVPNTGIAVGYIRTVTQVGAGPATFACAGGTFQGGTPTTPAQYKTTAIRCIDTTGPIFTVINGT